MKSLTIKSTSLELTHKIGAVIAGSLFAGRGILLTGDLGTGKTSLVTGICRGLGVTGHVKSPTFVLAWLYDGPVQVYHVDLYRLSDYCELENIGWEDMADEEHVYLVEWADRFPLPYTEKAVRISLDYGVEPDDRIMKLEFNENEYPNLEKDLKVYADSGN